MDLCLWCEEPLTDPVADSVIWTEEGPRHQHRECAIRTVTGGIGHLIAHDYWCSEKHDPDGGLTARQSALLAYLYWRVVAEPAFEREAVEAPDG